MFILYSMKNVRQLAMKGGIPYTGRTNLFERRGSNCVSDFILNRRRNYDEAANKLAAASMGVEEIAHETTPGYQNWIKLFWKFFDKQVTNTQDLNSCCIKRPRKEHNGFTTKNHFDFRAIKENSRYCWYDLLYWTFLLVNMENRRNCISNIDKKRVAQLVSGTRFLLVAI